MSYRHKKTTGHDNHERWLVSYADFITLLFAFFVVMFANAEADKSRTEAISESVRRALEGSSLPALVAGLLGAKPAEKGAGQAIARGPGGSEQDRKGSDDRQLAELGPSLALLRMELEKELAAGDVKLELQPRGLVVSLLQAAYFPSGEDTIDPSRHGSIEKVASAIRKLPNPVRLEGHTDPLPIRNSRFRSNWELSSARSIAMLELLSSKYGVPAGRLSVAGYADTVPVENNDSVEGRSRNRRVDIVILSERGVAAEPEKKPQTQGH